MSVNTKNIFFNMFQFSFRNAETETDYQKMREEKLRYYYKFLLGFLFLQSIFCSVFISFFLENYNKNNIVKFDIISSYITTLLYLILISIGWNSKNIKTMRWINYTIYFFKVYFNQSFRHIVLTCTHIDDTILHLAYFFEINFRMMWTLYYVQSFYENFLLNFLSIGTIFLIVPFLSSYEDNIKGIEDMKSYAFILLSVSCFCYVLERHLRISYFYKWMAEKKFKWLYNVLNSMNSGFVSLKGGNLAFINNYLQKHLKDVKSHSKLTTNRNDIQNRNLQLETLNLNMPILIKTNRNEKDQNFNINDYFTENYNEDENKEILENLFHLLSNLNIDSLSDHNVSKILTEFLCNFKESSIIDKNFYDFFIKSISQISDIQNFKLIGDITLETDEVDVSFEIHCRFFKTEKDEELEILFNDVTRTKTREKQNAEFKYKSLFLSKVAHEFKNPLICIGELIDQSHEQTPIDSNLKKTLDQIKSLSDFLLVLVKDLNHFSEYQMGKNSLFIEKETDLKELLKFCKNITNSLLTKCGKQNSINFTIDIDDFIPRWIISDEWRLKQVLINLISNSVKFSMTGQITLQIYTSSEEQREGDKYLSFCVKDTGLGMKEEFSRNLFKPFNKGNFKNNEMGAGLGLVIVNDIASKLGTGIKFESFHNEGSTFWFSIPLKKGKSDILLEKHEFENSNCEESIATRVLSEYAIEKIATDSISNTSGGQIILSFIIDEEASKKESESVIDNDNFKICRSSVRSSTNKILPNNNIFRSKKTSVDTFSKFMKNDISHADSNKNKFDSNIDINLQDFSKIDINKFDLNLNQSQKIFNFKNNTFNINMNGMTRGPIKGLTQIIESRDDFINILVADDEIFTRQSTIRILQNLSNSLKIKLNIIEADDGLETIYLVYRCITQGVRISMIISDENMNFMYGSRTAEILAEIISRKRIAEIPFYLLTAYDNILIQKYISSSIRQILTKPLTKDTARILLVKAMEK